jgi:hypothetical protein
MLINVNCAIFSLFHLYKHAITMTSTRSINQSIAGRSEERQVLRSCLNDVSMPSFLAVLGRRRVGKTYLVTRELRDNWTFHLVAQGPRTSVAGQLELFYLAMEKNGMPLGRMPESWSEAFYHLAQGLEKHHPDKPKWVIVLDEVPWFDTKRSGFLEALAHFWNSWAESNPKVMLVITGSASYWITRKVERSRGSLYGRLTHRLWLEPFTLPEMEEYFNMEKKPMLRREIVHLAMTLGGVPYYLSQVLKHGCSAERAVDKLCFASSGRLRNEFDEMYRSLFEDSERHEAIIRCLAKERDQGGWLRDEIVKVTGIPDGGALTRNLEELELCGFISARLPLGKASDSKIFRLQDEFSAFHLHWLDTGMQRQGDWLDAQRLPRYYNWAGRAFERLCLRHVELIKQQILGKRGVNSKDCPWQVRANDKTDGAQVDLVIQLDNEVLLCEMKHPCRGHSDGLFRITKEVAEAFEKKKAIFRARAKIGARTRITPVFITPYGIHPGRGGQNPYKTAIGGEEIIAERDFFH